MADIQSVTDIITKINSFTTAVWLCPIAFTLHVIEELPRFTPWVQRHINPYFTRRHYLNVHLAGIIVAVLVAFILWLFPARLLVFFCFTFFLTPSFFCNVFFHTGASIAYRSYSPGLLTALFIYLPLYALICKLAFPVGLMSGWWWLFSTILATCVHTLEVRHNVFRFRPSTALLQETDHKSPIHFR